jgi:hypothetical protein
MPIEHDQKLTSILGEQQPRTLAARDVRELREIAEKVEVARPTEDNITRSTQ